MFFCTYRKKAEGSLRSRVGQGSVFMGKRGRDGDGGKMVGPPAIVLLLLLLLEPPRAAGFPFPCGHHLQWGTLLQPLRGGRGPLPPVKSGLRPVHIRPPTDPSERVRSPRFDAPPCVPCGACVAVARALLPLSVAVASGRVTVPALFARAGRCAGCQGAQGRFDIIDDVCPASAEPPGELGCTREMRFVDRRIDALAMIMSASQFTRADHLSNV